LLWDARLLFLVRFSCTAEGYIPPDVATQRWVPYLPPDNVLPAFLAERLVDHAPVEPFIDDGNRRIDHRYKPVRLCSWSRFELGCILTRCIKSLEVLAGFWAIGLWVLLSGSAFEVQTTVIAVVTLGGSGTILFNMGYVWPKLLSSSLVLIADSCLWREPTAAGSRFRSSGRWAFAGIAAALSLLAHGAGMHVMVAPMQPRRIKERQQFQFS
jgi:hypothetical protein